MYRAFGQRGVVFSFFRFALLTLSLYTRFPSVFFLFCVCAYNYHHELFLAAGLEKRTQPK